LIEQMPGNRKRGTAARILNVEVEVFKRLGELTSTKGSIGVSPQLEKLHNVGDGNH
jgi:hypothetical protein